MDEPEIGSTAHVYPMPGLAVQDGPVSLAQGGRFLPPEGREVIWSEWWHRRHRDGSISLHDPRPQPKAQPAPARKPSPTDLAKAE